MTHNKFLPDEVLQRLDTNGFLAYSIISTLKDRSGFDGWWDSIDEDIQDEIFDEIVEILKWTQGK